MRKSVLTIGLAAGLMLAGLAARAGEPGVQKTINPNNIQSFVGNWSPSDKPLCAALRSQADWDKLMHPAPVMGSAKPFSPARFDWSKNGILILARVINAGATSKVFRLSTVQSTPKALEVNYAFKPTPPASSTIKWYLAVAAPKPFAGVVHFNENGKTVCSLDLAHGQWASPKPAA